MRNVSAGAASTLHWLNGEKEHQAGYAGHQGDGAERQVDDIAFHLDCLKDEPLAKEQADYVQREGNTCACYFAAAALAAASAAA